ncbi:hypothetical protein SYNPS1DRAFT_28533 [Syncephalis pseudoplumigaleata]|uniref:UDP-glycosyltransferases domain-containing protein n=1 Tax=Syncephalis pseudoplumigaleata TaxID=1712513 RepID=A0A4P9Z021_9FUNG|nr:hypothetical protein SYNPS1DRAFT_28533 [Syncephalis pseudoplumigaleata]|eukprot:RKP25746.1 hypothetical protein SYNPS1DRAFT_28533 [Syncephalis pseudoplumigaleata]
MLFKYTLLFVLLLLCTHGSSSHARPQLSIGRVLVARGHKVAFAGYNETLPSWMQGYPEIEPIGMGAYPMDHAFYEAFARNFIFPDEESDSFEEMMFWVDILFKSYLGELAFYRQLLMDRPIDVVICDFTAESCIDAAHEAGIPFIVTATSTNLSLDASQPYVPMLFESPWTTYEHAPFIDRLYETFILPAKRIATWMKYIEIGRSTKRAMGIEPYGYFSNRWRDGLVLITNFMGLEATRPLPANMFLIGPLISSEYPPLTEELRAFLDAHRRSIYVGFGTITILPAHRIAIILRALLRAHQDGLVDGVVWALARTATDPESMPRTLTVDGVAHSIEDMRTGRHPVVRLLDHAPQRAILHHPSTQLFITHCGLSSVVETAEAGVPFLGLPLFSDQPSNALKLEQLGAGLWLRRPQTNEAALAAALRRLLAADSSERASFRVNAARVQSIVRIANRAHERAADIVELATIPGAIAAHASAALRMPWWKARNYDLYLFVALFIGAFVYAAISALRYAMHTILAAKQKQKQA